MWTRSRVRLASSVGLGLAIFLMSCQTPTPSLSEGEQPNRKLKAGFLMIDGVYNSELMAPYDIFQHTVFHTDHGIEVFTVAPTMEPVTTFEGLQILPHYSFDDHPPIDILVVASAEHNMDSDLENERLISWVKAIGKQSQYVMSLCDGAFVLAKAGLVEGRISTTFPSDIERYRSMFPQLDVRSDQSFVHDGQLLTSAGGAKSYDVALYLVHELYGEKVAQGVGRGLVIDWDPSDYQFLTIDR